MKMKKGKNIWCMVIIVIMAIVNMKIKVITIPDGQNMINRQIDFFTINKCAVYCL